MRLSRVILISLLVFGLAVTYAVAADVEKGKALFNDVKFGGGTAGKSCNSCHPDGKGLDPSKKVFQIMGKTSKGLEDAVNFCIEKALKGKPIDKKSDQMKDITAYIKSLGGKSPAAEKAAPKKKKTIEGC